MAYQDQNGQWQIGEDPRTAQWKSSGLDPSLISQTYTPGQVYGKQTNYLGQDVGAGFSTPGTYKTVYNGPGGQWTQNPGGSWSNGMGTNVSDLGAFLQKQQKIASGSDFSGYQNQLNNLLANPSSISQNPAYQFALDQGNQAINRSAAAKGTLNSGNVLAELAKYGQGMASQGYQQQLNNLQGLMQGAQNFGIQSGYFAPPTPANQQAIPGLNKPSWGNV